MTFSSSGLFYSSKAVGNGSLIIVVSSPGQERPIDKSKRMMPPANDAVHGDSEHLQSCDEK